MGGLERIWDKKKRYKVNGRWMTSAMGENQPKYPVGRGNE
jgi:hypothetical protein